MKKAIVCGIASLALAATPVFSAFAEAPQTGNSQTGYFTGSKSVNVGEVEETVYSVDINWGDMVFDWKYAKDINKFGFEPALGCQSYPAYYQDNELLRNYYDHGVLYQDSTCGTLYEQEPVDGTAVYAKIKSQNGISVEDDSINGKIKVSASFTPSSNYNWVTGEFTADGAIVDGNYINTYNVPRNYYYAIGDDLYRTYGESYSNGQIPDSIVHPGIYVFDLLLRTNPGTDLSSVTINTNDKIGTVIIGIEPDLD